MSVPSDPESIQPVTRQGQIIIGGLISGVVFFLVIATVVDLGPNPGLVAGGAGAGQPAQTVPLVTYLALAFGAVLLPMSFIVPGLVAKQQRQAIAAGNVTAGTNLTASSTAASSSGATKTPAGGLPAAYLTQLITGAAMNEGAAFFAGVAYLIEKNPIALVVAFVLLAALVARFPTGSRVERWLEQQQEKLREDQLDARSAS
jgi:hypothetical protein